jgi:hypothetical protein
MARTKVSSSRAQPPRPADNVLSLLNRIRLFEERENHFSQALQSAMDQAETMEASLRARITDLCEDNAWLRNEVVRVSRLNQASESESEEWPREPESESESESDYAPEEHKQRPWLQDIYASIEDTGNRAQRFRGILRKIVRFPNYDINQVYNEVLNTDRYSGPLQKEDIHPNFWTALGRNEDEKKENAKRVVELLYRRPY